MLKQMGILYTPARLRICMFMYESVEHFRPLVPLEEARTVRDMRSGAKSIFLHKNCTVN